VICWHQKCLGRFEDCETVGEAYKWAMAHLDKYGADHGERIRALVKGETHAGK